MKTIQPEKNEYLDARSLFQLIWRRKWVLLAVAVIAAATTFAIAKSLAPLYESHAILFPGSSNSRDKQLEEFKYGYEADSERLVQFLGSEVLLDSLELKFGLAEMWDIDKSSLKWYDDLVEKAKDRILFHKTRHSSVVVSVIDEVPTRAAQIANEACRLVNIINSNIVKANAAEVLASLELEFAAHRSTVEGIHDTIGNLQFQNSQAAVARLQEDILSTEKRMTLLRDSINTIRRRHNIFDYGYQVNVLNEQLAEARSMLLQESGSLEILESKNFGNDTLRIATESRKRGAQRRVDFFEKELRELGEVNNRYTSSLEKLAVETARLASSNNELNKLQQSIEPKVSSRGLSRLESELDFDQYRLNELHAKYEDALSNFYNPPQIAHNVSPARPSFKKIYPKTLLSLVIAVVGSIMMAVVCIAVLEYLRGKVEA